MSRNEYDLRRFIDACSHVVERVTRIVCIVRKDGRIHFCHLYCNGNGLHAEQVLLKGIEAGAFNATDSEILLFSNHSPCGMCCDILCRFMSTNQRVTMVIKFTEVYRTHGPNTIDGIKRKNRESLKTLNGVANLKLSVMVPDDWLFLLDLFCVNPTTRSVNVRDVSIRPLINRILQAANNMEQRVGEIVRATRLLGLWRANGSLALHTKTKQQMLIIREATLKLGQTAGIIQGVAGDLFGAIKNTKFANIEVDNEHCKGIATKRVAALQKMLDKVFVSYIANVPKCNLTAETGSILYSVITQIRDYMPDVSYLSQIATSDFSQTCRKVMYSLVQMDIRYEDMFNLERRELNTRRLEEIVFSE